MNMYKRTHRIVAGVLLATLAVSALAPAAFAGHGRGGNKYRRGDYGYSPAQRAGWSTRTVVERRSSSAGPAIAGFIGGLAVGSILSHRDNCGGAVYYERGYARPAVVRETYIVRDRCADPAYYYQDPWTQETYASLGVYRSECRGHWPIARVIDARSGACVQYVCWHDGGWHNYDASDPPWACSDRRGGYRHGGDYSYRQSGDWDD